MEKYVCTFSLLLLTLVNGYSQGIENVSFVQSGNKIMVSYDLVSYTQHEVYDVRLKFVSDKGQEIIPFNVKGDLVKLNPGKNKKIEWDVLADGKEITTSIQAIVELTGRHSTKIKGGPSNAFLSLLVPGLGDYYVDLDKEKQLFEPYYITVATYGMLLLGYSYKVESNKSYDEYHNATDQTTMDRAYDAANQANHTFIICTSIGATIWAADIAWVAYKGFKNRKEQRAGFAYKKYETQYYASYIPNGFQFNFKIKF
jgi:hypothetical protein